MCIRDRFRSTLDLLKKTGAKTIVETGTSREGLLGAKSNGAATIVFGKWAKNHNGFLHSVDISKQSVAAAQREVEAQELGDFVKIYLSDSIKFLRSFEEKVDFLYLDSYDYSNCLLYTSDAADDLTRVDLGGRRIIKKK